MNRHALPGPLILAAVLFAAGCASAEIGPAAEDTRTGSVSGGTGGEGSDGAGGAASGGGGAGGGGATTGSGTGAGGGGTTTGTGTGAGGGGTTTGTGTGAGGGGAIDGVDPSHGKGGPIAPGQTGKTAKGAIVRLPVGYDPAHKAAPVVWLFNEELPQWSAIADADGVVLVDLDEYNDINLIVDRLNDSVTVLEAEYEVDKARYYWAGWSAGGNIVIMIAAENQDTVAGTLVFPGTGGGDAQPYMQQNKGHKLRLYYACGDQDPNFSWSVVENEANVWASYGYQTKFDKVAGAAHYIDEAQYGVRATGWAWMKGFNLKN